MYDRLLTEEGAYASLSVGDLLYDYLRVDPEVVKTLDIIHPNDDLSNPILAGWYKKTKMDFFSENSSNPNKAFEGHENRDFGYSAERYFGQQFQNQGAEVSYPESLNNPGFDLYVNGIKIQSKVGSSSLIDKHFEKYPPEDYPNRLRSVGFTVEVIDMKEKLGSARYERYALGGEQWVFLVKK